MAALHTPGSDGAPLAWLVDAPELAAHHTKTPHHLQERFAHCRSMSPDTLRSRLDKASQRREARLAARAATAHSEADRLAHAAARRQARETRLRDMLAAKDRAAARRRGDALGGRAARCAQHWRRALQVRRAAAVRHEDRTVRLAQQYLQKLAAARRRRRATVCPPDIAARVIQRWFRRHCLRTELATLARAGLLAAVPNAPTEGDGSAPAPLPFETMADRLQDPAIQQASQRLLCTVDRATTIAQSQPTPETPARSSARLNTQNRHRVFLAAFMIRDQPDHIFDHQGPLEQAVREAATAMLAALAGWADAEASSRGSHDQHHVAETLTEEHIFSTAWARYSAAFRAWQRRDLSSLVDGLVAHHQQLTALRDTVTAGDSPDAAGARLRWLPHIDAQQQAVEEKLRTMHADAQADACEAQRCDRLHREARREARLQARHRTVSNEEMHGSDSDDAPSDDPAASAAAIAASAMTMSPQLSRRSSLSASCTSSSLNLAAAIPTTHDNAGDDDLEESPAHSAASPDEVDARAMEAMTALWDANLVHEVAVDSNFRLETLPSPHGDGDDLASRIRVQARRALLDVIEEDLTETPPRVDRFRLLLTEVLEGLQGATLPRQTALREEIAGRVDVNLICHQLAHNALDEAALRAEVVRQAQRLSSPGRDEELRALADAVAESTPSLVRFLDRMTTVLQHMALDMANFLLAEFRPLIRKHAVEVERERLERAWAAGGLPLHRTRAWLQSALVAAREKAGRAPHMPALDDHHQASYLTVFYSGMESLLLSPDYVGLDEEKCPELLLADLQRLRAFRDELDLLVYIASVHTVATATVPHLKDADRFGKALGQRLSVVLADNPDKGARMPDMAHHVIEAAAEANSRPLSDAQQAQLQSMIAALQRSTHPVLTLLQRRVADELRRCFDAECPEDVVPKPNTGFDIVADRLHSVCTRAAQLAQYNKEVGRHIYDQCLQELAE